MTVDDDIAYLRGLSSFTLASSSVYRFRQIADRMAEREKGVAWAIQELRRCDNQGYANHIADVLCGDDAPEVLTDD